MKKTFMLLFLWVIFGAISWIMWSLSFASEKNEASPLPDYLTQRHPMYLDYLKSVEGIQDPAQRQIAQAWAYEKYKKPYLTLSAKLDQPQTDIGVGRVPTPLATASKENDGIRDIETGIGGYPAGIERAVTHLWQKTVEGGAYRVITGYEREKPEQGWVLWAKPQRAFVLIPAPRLSGTLRIVEEKDMILRLDAEDGQTFYFDTWTGRFIDEKGRPEIIPTLPK